MKRLQSARIALLLAVAGIGLLPGPGGAPRSLDALLAASDGIVVGSIVQGTATGTDIALSIQVERTLKGTWTPEAIIAASGTVTEPSPTRAIAPQRGIFFLSGTGNGPLRLVPPMSGYLGDEMFLILPLPQASVPAAAPTVNASARDRVLLEILGGLQAGGAMRIGGFIDPISAYWVAPTPAITAVLRGWLAAGSPLLKAAAVRGLLAEGDVGVLSSLASNPALRATAAEAQALDGLRYYFKNPDPAAVAPLGALASNESNIQDLRVAAASALARLHTKPTLPILGQLLESSNPDLRVLAVGGLSMFANNVPIGSHEPAAGDWPWRTEDTIAHSGMNGNNLAFWKSWWAANQAALMR